MSRTVKRNPAWTEAELILALDLYRDLPRSQISAKNERVIALSEILNRLRAADQNDPLTYRNSNGTALKLHNFARFDPAVQFKGMAHGAKLERTIWERFEGRDANLKEAANAIRSLVQTS